MVLSLCNKNGKSTDEQIDNIFGQCNYSEKLDCKTAYFSVKGVLEMQLAGCTECVGQTWHQFVHTLIKGINIASCYVIFSLKYYRYIFLR